MICGDHAAGEPLDVLVGQWLAAGPGALEQQVETIRIVIAADQYITRTGVVTALRRDPNLEIAGEAGDGARTVALCRDLRPCVLILALRRSPLASFAVARLLKGDQCPPRMLFLGERADRHAVQMALDAGGLGYLLASADQGELLQGVYRAYAGRQVVPAPEDNMPAGPGVLCT